MFTAKKENTVFPFFKEIFSFFYNHKGCKDLFYGLKKNFIAYKKKKNV